MAAQVEVEINEVVVMVAFHGVVFVGLTAYWFWVGSLLFFCKLEELMGDAVICWAYKKCDWVAFTLGLAVLLGYLGMSITVPLTGKLVRKLVDVGLRSV